MDLRRARAPSSSQGQPQIAAFEALKSCATVGRRKRRRFLLSLLRNYSVRPPFPSGEPCLTGGAARESPVPRGQGGRVSGLSDYRPAGAKRLGVFCPALAGPNSMRWPSRSGPNAGPMSVGQITILGPARFALIAKLT